MYNYHTHTHYCDGSAEPELYVLNAVEQKMKVLGFSAHAPVSFDNAWSLKTGNKINYCKRIQELKEQYADKIIILNGLEIDYIPGLTTPFAEFIKNYSLDFTIGSVHLVKSLHSNDLWFIDGAPKNYETGLSKIFNDDIKTAVGAYYKQIQEMVVTQHPVIIGHVDKIKMNNKKRFFTEDERWYIQLVDDTLKVIYQHNSIVELNTRGVYSGKSETFFPSAFILEKCHKMKIPVMINSDAHKPEQLTLKYSEAIDLLKDIGFKKLWIIDQEGKRAIDIDDYF